MLQVPCPFWQLLHFYLPSWTSPRSSHSFSIWNSQSHLRLNTSKNMPSLPDLGFFHVSPAQRMASSPICPGVEIRNLRVVLSTNPSLNTHVRTQSVGFDLLIYPFLSSTLWTFYVLCFHRTFACTVRTKSPHLNIYFFKEGSHLQ